MKRLMIFAVAAVGATLASCSKSDLQVPHTTGKPNELPVHVSLTPEALTGSFGPVSQASQTKAAVKEKAEGMSVVFGGEADTKSTTELTTAQDSKVYNVWAIQFKADGKLLGMPYYTKDIPNPGTATGVDATYSLSVNLTSNTEGDGKVYFITNTNDAQLFNIVNAESEDKMKQVLKNIGTELKPTALGGIPMFGVYQGPVSSSSAIGAVSLKRLMAKVILKYKVNSAFPGFTVDSVRLRKAAANIYFTTEPTATPFPAKNTTVGKESHIDYPAENVANAATDGDYKKFVWYVPENLRGTASGITAMGDRIQVKEDGTVVNTDGNATYLEIKGTLKSASQCVKATYIILLGNPTANKGDFNVKRNNVYTVTVDILGVNTADKRITVESFDMSNSAMIKPNSGDDGAVTFDIRKCVNNGFTTAANLASMMGSSSTLTADVLWQDGNVINTADITLDRVNGLLTVKSSKATEGNAIVALYPNSSKTQGSILWSWHVWVTSYHPDGSKAYGLAANSKASVDGGQVHTYGTNYTSKNGNKVIMDRNLGATKAYYAAPAANDANADLSFGMFYQWGRKDPFPRVKGSTINETAATGTTIPIYGANGATVLPEDGTGYKKVNITTSGVISGTNTLAYSVKNPLAFIYNATTPYDWYTNASANQNNTLWGDGAQKSPYDPCPKGWRIGPNGTWSDFTRDATTPLNGTFPYYMKNTSGTNVPTENGNKYYATNGRLYKVSTSGAGTPLAWYPAPGYRSHGTGALAGVGNEGSVWSAAVSGTYGVYLRFVTSAVQPSYAHGRAIGLQVRCLQE